uniref:Phosphatidylinositol3 putative n=1 Tax=Albugo laibachii Nc14 TaxID=890382 RepID=F0W1Y8_9STRA|nr:phosphatidylinositol3 putative [Albugo laibachii Nc14]|eukprot:CCA15067.1 phosphatidylinositol3 putative [Albugo laibachii Nc14]
MPPKQISPWIPLGGGNFDIIAVGLQESNYKEKDRDEKDFAAVGIKDIYQGVSDCVESRSKKDSISESEDKNCLDRFLDPTSTAQPAIPGGEVEHDNSINNAGGQDVIIKRPRSHKSYRKVKRIVRKVSENIRDSVSDAFDYSFSKQLQQQLGEHYILANKVELMEMRLFLFVHEKHTVTAVEKISIPTGLGSVLGNKVG